MALYQILYWKGIPAQVRVFPAAGRPISRLLPERFQLAIDAQAMREGIHATDDYLRHWQWSEKKDRDLPVEELLDTIVRELEAQVT